MLFSNNREPYEPEDVLIIFKDDGTADIAPIVTINDERVYAESPQGNYSVPVGEVRSYVGRKGRIFLYPTTVENVTDCQRIAALERSTVLRSITHFEEDSSLPRKPLPIGKIMLGIAVAILLIIILKAV
ncbi:hypothetical protein [Paenibacillus macerans]|uniref:hypothetical protein n=1 Tax=Paenibacillus macerans TaxID=44252 RepID=UPI000EDDC32A|nr:hypothetical protein [Paenibacillus macerans]GBK66255.1 hypothetical protein PbDSM24746_62590 [Paenibacillus macerans]GBK72564.1 hypothetical protein PbJCM17693_62720 [Paenibacillus macerans]